MGFFRFRRSIKIAPGVRINLSKSGVSTSIGTRGATINLRGDRVRETVGIPGTGISYSEQQRIAGSHGDGAQTPPSGHLLRWFVMVALLLLVYAFFR